MPSSSGGGGSPNSGSKKYVDHHGSVLSFRTRGAADQQMLKTAQVVDIHKAARYSH